MYYSSSINYDKALSSNSKKDIAHGSITIFCKIPKGIEKYSPDDENFQYVKKLKKLTYIPKYDLEAESDIK